MEKEVKRESTRGKLAERPYPWGYDLCEGPQDEEVLAGRRKR